MQHRQLQMCNIFNSKYMFRQLSIEIYCDFILDQRCKRAKSLPKIVELIEKD